MQEVVRTICHRKNSERISSPDAKADRNAAQVRIHSVESNAAANCLPLLNLTNRDPATY